MANIKIDDIKPTGAQLFIDTESFIKDLQDNELKVAGGFYAGDFAEPVIIIVIPDPC
ncbi:hypothetical protein [Moorena sp. SIO3B2]|uniref:hypothetical protein n=1 Tax=Moorena sp. SIO3B2 TaxID=2607827 RepID=UPI0013CD74FC|nr:hypothetical protein [Moorena sp. SIO3B2]NEP34868.1 hypothetical protein [Moorena sp. SIO3B2]